MEVSWCWWWWNARFWWVCIGYAPHKCEAWRLWFARWTTWWVFCLVTWLYFRGFELQVLISSGQSTFCFKRQAKLIEEVQSSQLFLENGSQKLTITDVNIGLYNNPGLIYTNFGNSVMFKWKTYLILGFNFTYLFRSLSATL